MKWLRCRLQGGASRSEGFGTLDGNRQQVFAGNLFQVALPTGKPPGHLSVAVRRRPAWL